MFQNELLFFIYTNAVHCETNVFIYNAGFVDPKIVKGNLPGCYDKLFLNY